MKIDIVCACCEATAFIDVLTDCCDEPCNGLYLPEGWEASNEFQRPLGDQRWTGVRFLCPKHSSYEKEKL